MKNAISKSRRAPAPVGVLGKVLKILELLDRSTSGLQLRQIAEQTRLNKSTAYRFLAHLEREGYLVRDSAGAYLIGSRLVHLGANSTYQSTIRKVSRPSLEALWRETRETVNLGVLDRGEILYLDVIESPHNFRLSSQPGMRRPADVTALGKAILAALPANERDEVLMNLLIEKRAQEHVTNLTDLIAELSRIERRGYALDNEEVERGACCVGAPIFDSSGLVCASISVSGPITRIHRGRLTEIAVSVTASAEEISTALGHPKETAVRAAAMRRRSLQGK